MTYQLAQVNIARLMDAIDSTTLAGFVSALDRINALAERTPGFVWRLKGDHGNDATSIKVFDDEYLIINMSVWESIDALYQYTYYSDHVDLFRQRRDWFHKMDTHYLALWWIPEGHQPTPDEAKAKIEDMDAHGITPHAFTFKQRYTVEEWQDALAGEGVS